MAKHSESKAVHSHSASLFGCSTLFVYLYTSLFLPLSLLLKALLFLCVFYFLFYVSVSLVSPFSSLYFFYLSVFTIIAQHLSVSLLPGHVHYPQWSQFKLQRKRNFKTFSFHFIKGCFFSLLVMVLCSRLVLKPLLVSCSSWAGGSGIW